MSNETELSPEQSSTEPEVTTITTHVLGQTYFVMPQGIYTTYDKREVYLCSKINVENRFRDHKNAGWGRLISLTDHDGHEHRFVMTAAELGKDEATIIARLRDHGLTVTTRRYLHYLIVDLLLHSEPRNNKVIRSSSRTGWQTDSVYLLGDNTVIGESTEQYLLQSQSPVKQVTQRGSLEEWKQQVASLCRGNSRLIFGISTAFASTLLHNLGMEGGGFHLFGSSSDGKTTTLHVAASAIDQPLQYIQPWRATDNGMEGIAKQHNHSLLILDEQGEMAPQDLGKVSYFLSNGKGKTRAMITGEAKPRAEWLLYYLSSGEMTLGEQIGEVGKQAKAGQEVRHVDIPANAGKGMGVFENIHSSKSSADFADLLKQRAGRYYGTAFRSFIQSFISADNMRNETLERYLQDFLDANMPIEACGQVKRVAHKFAVVAAAGMLASAWGITGWETEEVNLAISKMFQDWLDHRAHTRTHESEQIITRIQGYLQQYGVSRFIEAAYTTCSKLQAISDQRRTPLQLDGFIINKNEGNEYYLFPTAFDRIIQGMNRSSTIKFLVEEGYLLKGSDGRNQAVKRLPGFKQTRVYHLSHKIMLDELVTEETVVTENNIKPNHMVTGTTSG